METFQAVIKVSKLTQKFLCAKKCEKSPISRKLFFVLTTCDETCRTKRQEFLVEKENLIHRLKDLQDLKNLVGKNRIMRKLLE